MLTEPTDIEVITFTPETLAKLPELLNILQNEIDAQWRNINKTPILGINALIVLGEKTQALGDDYNYPPLQNWGNLLHTQAKLFDMNVLPITLREYPNLVYNLTEFINHEK